MRFVFVILAIVATLSGSAYGQAVTVFKGLPEMKVSEGGIERVPETMPRERAVNFECVVSKIGDEYYWASRENKLLIKLSAGAFDTYIAIDGIGYIRVIRPEMKQFASLMGDTEAKFDYVEHVVIGLRSVTYWGRAR